MNPFGTLFHPFAILNALTGPGLLHDDLFLDHQGLVHHHWLPKTFYGESREALSLKWDLQRRAIQNALKLDNSVLFLTLGTSFFYTFNDY
ncbi:MAG: GSCFA domain-containing protein [Chitinophagaceae bacterium]|nr:GSCFA domain-containing protein [Oligoflexus sp.]